MLLGSRLLPPVLMLVVSRGVARMVTASPPLTSSCSTWVWYSPCTHHSSVVFVLVLVLVVSVVIVLVSLYLDWFAVDVCDEVPGSEPGLVRGAAPVHLHDEVVHRVEVSVPEVDADGAQREAEAPGPCDNQSGVSIAASC